MGLGGLEPGVLGRPGIRLEVEDGPGAPGARLEDQVGDSLHQGRAGTGGKGGVRGVCERLCLQGRAGFGRRPEVGFPSRGCGGAAWGYDARGPSTRCAGRRPAFQAVFANRFQVEERQLPITGPVFRRPPRLGQQRVAERGSHRFRRGRAEFFLELQFPGGAGGLRFDLGLVGVERNLLEDPVDQLAERDPGRTPGIPRRSFHPQSLDVHLPEIAGGFQRGERGGRDCPAGRDLPAVDGLPPPGEEGGFGCLPVAGSVPPRIRPEQIP